MQLARLTIIGVLALAGAAGAGPIDPPAGPVQSTMKPLDQVEARTPVTAETCPGDEDSVFRISEPGSYYLTGNLQGVSGRHGVEIAASGVTLDLNGFLLSGVQGSLSGVHTPSTSEGVTIRNGHVTGWGEDGVSMGEILGQRSGVVEGVVSSHNGGEGIHAGTAAVVRACSAHDNGGNGISAYTATVVESCSAFANGAYGIYASEGATITGCAAAGNSQHGISGGQGATITACSARWNVGDGIRALSGSTIAGCTAWRNQGDGIEVNDGCTVRDNDCHDNDGASSAGVRATGGSNRIEGNNLTSNTRGTDVTGTVNIIVGNTARANGVNYVIVSGNRVGTIVVPPLSGAINGNGGAAGSGATDPWSNIAF